MRINKFLAGCGIASRRAAEQFVLSGRVKVNGKSIKELATQINENDIVEVDGRNISLTEEKIYIIMNKPQGCVTTCSDDKGRRTVLDVLGRTEYRVFPVGRLDYDTEGLLLLTNDGEFARRIMHPSSMISKTYVAVLNNDCTAENIKQLCAGVVIDGKKTSPAKVNCSNNRRSCEIIIHEGRNRQVRKMFEAIGITVVKLKRIAIGNLNLGNLKPGEWKTISLAKLEKMF